MNSLKTIQTLSKIGKILCKIAFVFAVIGFCGCIVGMISLSVGGNILKLGGVTIHGIISENLDYAEGSLIAVLIGWLVVCAGEAVLAKYAELYFKNELAAGNPFTFAGAKELLRLGIITAVIPTVCAVVGSIVEGIASGIMDVEKAVELNMPFGTEGNITLGIMFIIAALLCRYGAEIMEYSRESEVRPRGFCK